MDRETEKHGQTAERREVAAVWQSLLDELLEACPKDERGRREEVYRELLEKTAWRLWKKMGLQEDAELDQTHKDAHRNEIEEFIGLIKEVGEVTFSLREQIDYDGLTKLLRRDAFAWHFTNWQKRMKENNQDHVTALAVIDLDFFKGLNDTYGHAVGDLVLKAVGEKLNKGIRATDAAGRMGGDEAAFLLTDIPRERMQIILTRLFKSLTSLVLVQTENDEYQVIDEHEAKEKKYKIKERVSVSMGVRKIESGERRGITLAAAMEQADSAAYTTKAEGRNGITIITDSDEESGKSSGMLFKIDKEGRLDTSGKGVMIRNEDEQEATLELVLKHVEESLNRVMQCVRRQNNGEVPSPIKQTLKELAGKLFAECHGNKR